MKNKCYWSWNNIIPFETCQKIINLGEEWKAGGVEGGESLDDIRKSDVVWLHDPWIYDLITPYLASANEQAGWKYDIAAAEICQVTRYIKDGFYSWHKDGMGSHNELQNDGTTRKLSMSIILNSEFEGGDFELRDLDERVPRLNEGSVIVFPSFIHHRVAPVTKGIRYSLVNWFVGPPFV